MSLKSVYAQNQSILCPGCCPKVYMTALSTRPLVHVLLDLHLRAELLTPFHSPDCLRLRHFVDWYKAPADVLKQLHWRMLKFAYCSIAGKA